MMGWYELVAFMIAASCSCCLPLISDLNAPPCNCFAVRTPANPKPVRTPELVLTRSRGTNTSLRPLYVTWFPVEDRYNHSRFRGCQGYE